MFDPEKFPIGLYLTPRIFQSDFIRPQEVSNRNLVDPMILQSDFIRLQTVPNKIVFDPNQFPIDPLNPTSQQTSHMDETWNCRGPTLNGPWGESDSRPPIDPM